VFRPVSLDGRTLIDGGACNPLPFEHVADCAITVACDVAGGPTSPSERMPGLMECVVGAAQISMQTVIREKLRWRQPDILVRPEINGVFVLDFLKTQAILDMNVAFKDDLKRRLDLAISMPVVEPLSPVLEEVAQKSGPPPFRRFRNKPLAHDGRWPRQRSGFRARPRRPSITGAVIEPANAGEGNRRRA
jgi:NTE family protein